VEVGVNLHNHEPPLNNEIQKAAAAILKGDLTEPMAKRLKAAAKYHQPGEKMIMQK